jgi:hypothetical protein
MAFSTPNKAKLCKIMIITLVFEKNAIFSAENCPKSQKIVIITSTPGRFCPTEFGQKPPSQLFFCCSIFSIRDKKECSFSTANKSQECASNRVTRGRCYDYNFLRFLLIFGKKLAFFSKTNVVINFFQKLAVV